ncbi:MAG: hypothetical protein SV686_04050 [Thermodesulfobacteriota bacterium]|jgi:hypothetical protein|nr:hypothetical protein [Thermodesulfobacteriota bacterium]
MEIADQRVGKECERAFMLKHSKPRGETKKPPYSIKEDKRVAFSW